MSDAAGPNPCAAVGGLLGESSSKAGVLPAAQ